MKRIPSAILVKQEFPPPLQGGARLYYHEILKRQPAGRFTVLTSPGGPDDAAFDATQPYRVLRKGYYARRGGMGYAYAARLLVLLVIDALKLLRREEATLLLGQLDWSVALGPLARRILGRPYVIFLHGEDLTTLARRPGWFGGLHRATTRRALVEAAAVVVNSRFTWDRALEFGASPDRLRLIHPGVDVRRFEPDAAKLAPAAPPRLLSVGRLFERKGIDHALEAVRILGGAFPGITLDVVGDGPDRGRLERLAKDLGIGDRVRFHGIVAAERLPSMYRSADLFLLPNRELPNADTEGFGIVLLEAAASGVPAIAGRAGGTREALLDGQTGLLVSAEPAGIADAATRILGDREAWFRMSRRARDWATVFSWEKAAEAFGAVLEEASRAHVKVVR